MFEFFKFGFLPGLFHLLFMMTLPVAIFFAANGALFLGGVVFFFGAPLFRSIRNSFLF